MYKSLKTVGLGAVFLAPMAFGAGFQLNEFSVAAQGRANAGEPAMSDTAAVIARNPAAMGAFDKSMVSVVYHYIDPNIDVEGEISTPIPAISANADADDIAPSASVPGLYFVNPINEQWAIGLALNSHFGLSTDYGSSYAGTEFAEETSVQTYYLTPSISFKPVETVSLGLGINYIRGQGLIKNSSSPTIEALTTTVAAMTPDPADAGIANNTTLLKLDGDGYDFGYQLGAAWDIDKNHRLGFRYQSGVNLDFEGDLTMFIPSSQNPALAAPGASVPLTGTLTLNLPEVYEIGYAGSLSDSFRLMAGIQKTGWGSFDSLTADIDQLNRKQELKDEDWKTAWRYSVGAEFDVSDQVTLRAGLGVDESPVQADKRTLTIPDADRNWLTLGATFNLKDIGSIDAALMYIDGGSVDVNETSKLGTTFNGELSAVNVLVYSIGYNYAF